MSLAADALQPSVVRILFSLGRTAHCNLADIIVPGRGAGFDLDFDDSEKTIKLDFREPNFIGSAFAGDALRFASAAFVSVKEVGGSIEDRLSLPWAMIRLYYSAFYAGHAILRLTGQSCSHLDRRHITKLQQLAAGYGLSPAFELKRGLYHCVMNSNQTGLTFASKGAASGGTHEVFWAIFDRFLQKATVDVLRGNLTPADAQLVFMKFDALRTILGSSGGGSSWLSTMRNDIQYRHDHGVWQPSSVKKRGREQLARLAEQWARDPLYVDVGLAEGSLDSFVVGCAFIVALCRALFARIAERSFSSGGSFARAPLSLC
jgi:hypothetical protein